MIVVLVVTTLVVGLFLFVTGLVFASRKNFAGIAFAILGILMCANTIPYFISKNNANRDKDIATCTAKGGRADIYGRNGEYVYCHMPKDVSNPSETSDLIGG